MRLGILIAGLVASSFIEPCKGLDTRYGWICPRNGTVHNLQVWANATSDLSRTRIRWTVIVDGLPTDLTTDWTHIRQGIWSVGDTTRRVACRAGQWLGMQASVDDSAPSYDVSQYEVEVDFD